MWIAAGGFALTADALLALARPTMTIGPDPAGRKRKGA
jgi:hypothetical protein